MCNYFFVKVVARNKIGQTTAKARLLLGDTPLAPDSPEISDVSDTEILLRWKVPRFDGNSPILCYRLQQKYGDGTDWMEVADNIDHEFYIVQNLVPDTEYQFRISARNKFGWGDQSIPTKCAMTKSMGSPKITVTRAMKYLQQITDSGQIIESSEDSSLPMDYTVERDPTAVKNASPMEDYVFVSEIARGRFNAVFKCAHQQTNKMLAAKVAKKTEASEAELAVLKTLCHERIVSLQQVTY